MIGILLAGGNGTRLKPYSNHFNKHFYPIVLRPMIYYSLLQFKLLEINSLLIVCKQDDEKKIKEITNYYFNFKEINFIIQDKANGAMHAIAICKKFLKSKDALINMGDHFLFDIKNNNKMVKKNISKFSNVFFCVETKNISEYGNIRFDSKENFLSIEEKSKKKYSNFILTGLFKISNDIFPSVNQIIMSKRKEYEVADFINNHSNLFNCIKLSKRYKWCDMGTFSRINSLNKYISTNETLFN